MITLEAGHLDSPNVLLDCGFLASGWALGHLHIPLCAGLFLLMVYSFATFLSMYSCVILVSMKFNLSMAISF